MRTTTLQSALVTVTEKLVQQLQQFTPAAFVIKPNEQCWSAAEVAEHLLIVSKNVTRVLQADGAVPDRAPDAKLAVIQEALLDRATRREAPDNVRPTGSMQDQQELITGLQKQMQLLAQVVEEKEQNELCAIYPHPRLGRLTRLEWAYFIVYHTERHCKQMEDIRSQVLTNVGAKP